MTQEKPSPNDGPAPSPQAAPRMPDAFLGASLSPDFASLPTAEIQGLLLLKAVKRLDAAMVDELLQKGDGGIEMKALPRMNVNVRDSDGMTALHHAAAQGARPCLRLLVASGRCDYLIRDNLGRYAFELAVEFARDFAVARLLVKKQVQQAYKQGVPAYVPRN